MQGYLTHGGYKRFLDEIHPVRPRYVSNATTLMLTGKNVHSNNINNITYPDFLLPYFEIHTQSLLLTSSSDKKMQRIYQF